MKKFFASAAFFLSLGLLACTDYQEEFDNNFGALEYADDEGGSSQSGGDEPLSSGTVSPQSSGDGEIEYKGQKYRTVTIGDQEWMAENLNYAVDGSFCYDDNAKNCDKFGRLYSWEAAANACPEGWHLPDSTEWAVLFKSVGTDAATHLKATSGWDSNADGNGDDASGFSVLPAGGGSISSGVVYYSSLTSGAVFWTNKKINDTEARSVSIYWKDKNPEFMESNINDRSSVRCIKDAMPSSSSSVKSSSSFKLPSVSVSSVNMHGTDYAVVTIGEQTWMAKSMEWQDVGSFCYRSLGGTCNDRGRFYKWEQAENICPEGWQLPDSSEWQTLFDAVGGQENAGKVLKSIGGNGSDGVEFNALLAGYMNSMNQYQGLDSNACFWVADGDGTKIVELQYGSDKAYFVTVQAGDAYSVRCIKGAGSSSSSSVQSSSSSVQSSSSSAKSSSSVVSSSSVTVSSSSVEIVKDRAGNEYPVVQIGEQYWMAENLNYKTEGSACYDDQDENCGYYGRLYTWEAAMTACPNGYKLPSQDDYSILWNYAKEMNGGSRPQDVLWAYGTWAPNADNKTGFSAYPGGLWNGSYDRRLMDAFFWTSTPGEVYPTTQARSLHMNEQNAYLGQDDPKTYMMSVRCVKDSE